VPWVTLLIALTASAAMVFPGAGRALQYDRDLLTSGQLWRIATCHLVHFNGEHFGWCLLATIILGGACEMLGRRLFLVATVSSILLIPIAMFEREPHVHTYRGLSGIASTFFVLLLFEVLRRRLRERAWVPLAAAGALGVAFVAKILLEMRFGVTIFVSNASRTFDPVPAAHLCGVLVAVLALGWSVVRPSPRR
jgi:rhomboid family GlyGly-CTERM serine protease